MHRSATPLRLILAIAIVLGLLPLARATEAGERVISPDRRFAVVTTAAFEGGREVRSYAIRVRATGRTLATCPDDARYESSPTKILWSPDSRFVAISTHTQRHGDLPDLWEVTSQKARVLAIDFSREDYDIYVTPKRWLDALNLECAVFGRTSSEHRRSRPNEPFVGYWLRIRIDPRSHKTKVFRSKPEIADQSLTPK
ncbi:MAG TPA: hypothetical protein VFG14_08885 [Chthoniobacteraceae bacterium]|nr:hypothetical protein [Chthoniobacteraceae bacterium]